MIKIKLKHIPTLIVVNAFLEKNRSLCYVTTVKD